VTALGNLLAALGSLLLIVLIGAVIPVLPTGAAVSAAAAVAWHRDGYTVLAVVAVGALAAYSGDIVTFALCRVGGEALTRRVRLSRKPIELAGTVKQRIERKPITALLVSRLIPAGRIPMLLAAAVVGISWRRFATANVPACLLWSAMYATVGLIGGAIFPEPWQGLVAAIVLVLAVSWLVGRIHKRREGSGRGRGAADAAGRDDSAHAVEGVSGTAQA
jgi:membrane protein DedA with SNARE-associated domain